MKDPTRVPRDEFVGPGEKKIDFNIRDAWILNHQLAKAHQQFFQFCQIDWRLAPHAFQRLEYICAFHHPPRQSGCEGRQSMRAIAQDFYKLSSESEDKHRTKLGIGRAAENQLISVSRDHRLHSHAVKFPFWLERRSNLRKR